jgi:hypothetical protein
MSKLSGIRDVDREILSKLDDRELLKVCSIDKYTWNTICDDAFLRRRLLAKYPKIESNKKESETWKHFFLRATRYIALLKERFGYDYTFGDFEDQYGIFLYYKSNELIGAAKRGELALVIWSLQKGADNIDGALRIASSEGRLEVVKYLVEHGADIHSENNHALKWASFYGRLEVVRYLVEHGADIHVDGDTPLLWASSEGNLDTVKYLLEAGADIHTDDDYALEWADRRGHSEVVNYLLEHGAVFHSKSESEDSD